MSRTESICSLELIDEVNVRGNMLIDMIKQYRALDYIIEVHVDYVKYECFRCIPMYKMKIYKAEKVNEEND